MKENISPEEKLLRLIRGEKKSPLAPLPAASGAVAAKKKTPLRFKAPAFIRSFFADLTPRKAMLVILFLGCVYLLSSIIYPFVALRKIKPPEFASRKTAVTDIGEKSKQKPLEEYLQSVSGRQIFGAAASSAANPASGASADLVKDINLVGIIAGDNPQAIIEDKKAQKTYYLNKGQLIGEMQLEDIQEGKIILNFNGQRFELHL